MTHFLLVYDRARGKLLEKHPFADGDEALRERFQRERDLGHDPNIEVVVLGARCEDDIRLTHGRYFSNERELLQAAQAATLAAKP